MKVSVVGMCALGEKKGKQNVNSFKRGSDRFTEETAILWLLGMKSKLCLQSKTVILLNANGWKGVESAVSLTGFRLVTVRTGC